LDNYGKETIKNFCKGLLLKPKADVLKKTFSTQLKNVKISSINNFLNKIFVREDINDSDNLIKLLNFIKLNNPKKNLAYQLTKDKKLNKLIWISDRMKANFDNFGDVILFDTTFKTNRFKLSLGIFLGISNNGKNSFFGITLLYNESEESFIWAFQKFNFFMKKEPITFVSDQDPAILAATQKIFPTTKLKICEWHVANIFKKNLIYLKKFENLHDIPKMFEKLIFSKDFENDY